MLIRADYDRGSLQACQKVVRWVGQMTEKIKDSLDGNNLESVLLEIGLRLHRVIQDHLLKFDYNTIGKISLISIFE